MSKAVVGRDSRALQAGGHRFDPGHVHQSIQRFSGSVGNDLFELVHVLVHTYPQKRLFRPLCDGV